MNGATDPGRSAWHRHAEQASLAYVHPQAAEAAERFDALSSVAERMALVREVVETRSAELVLAYRGLVMVSAGYRSRRDEAGNAWLHPEPCVVFVVKRKWSDAKRGPQQQKLPPRLLTFGPGPSRAKRVLYAVPTDVQIAATYARGRALGGSCASVAAPVPSGTLPGTLTCGVVLTPASRPARAFALSAMHVLSALPKQALPAPNNNFIEVDPKPSWNGTSLAFGGHIDAQRGHAFDVQLGVVSSEAALRAAFGGLRLSPTRPYVTGRETFDTLAHQRQFAILVPSNHPQIPNARGPLLAQFATFAGSSLPLEYQVMIGGVLRKVLVRHDELIVMRMVPGASTPVLGDSGSAVVTRWPDGSFVFVGMLIAASTPAPQAPVFVLPAWRLLDPDLWTQRPGGVSAFTPHLS
jgi:hypothetical protein